MGSNGRFSPLRRRAIPPLAQAEGLPSPISVKVISNKLPSSLIGYTIRKISEIMRLQQVQLQHPGVRQRVPGLAYAL